MPHIHCYLAKPSLVWTMFVTDMLIGIAYVAISVTLWALIKKIKLPFNFVVVCFGVFILACGLTHFMEVYTLWTPVYWLSALVKAITAAASVGTGIYLFRLRHPIAAVAEAAKLSEERRSNLERVNHELETRTDELSKMNRALEEQQKVLAHSAKMSALGEMAGGIAHEINSPLGIITVHANQLERFLKRGTLTPEMIVEEAKLISATALRIGNIIKGLRAFAREGEKDPFIYTPVSTVVADAFVLCQNRFKMHEIDLQISHVPAGLEIECRSVQIGQVLLNLLNNSFDAVASLPEKWVRLETEETEEYVIFSITDSGPGIPDSVLSKLFQPFFTTKEIGKGTGLGLSISKGICDAHHGTLNYDYTSSHTRFVLRLPKRHPMAKREEAAFA